jgi:FdhE protein
MSADLDTLYERMTERLNRLIQERSEHEEILGFYGKVLIAQQTAQKETNIPALELPEEHLQVKIQEGFALFERENLPVDRDSTERLFERLCRLCLDENPLLAADGKALLEALDAGKIEFPHLITAVLQGDTEGIETLAGELEVTAAVLQTLAKLSLQPSLLAVAAAAAQLDDIASWEQGYCPICGALPAMGALAGEGGKRGALCSFCGHFWQLPRFGCPFCNTSNQEELRYFYEEGNVLYRVQVCDHCSGYLKIIDTREGGAAEALAVEDVATAHLDLLAEEQGYHRKAPRLWGI